MSASAASVPDTSIGLSPAEVHLLRQHQAVALQSRAPSTASTRGRGTTRTPASSRAASAASSTSAQNRILLDASSLSALGAYFDRLMGRIQERVDHLSTQLSEATMAGQRSAARTVQAADREIARMKEVLRQMDELEAEFDKVKKIRDTVKALRGRVDGLGRRVGR